MNCAVCNKEMPDHPCCVVNMHQQDRGIWNAVVIGLDGKVAADFGPDTEKKVVDGCADFANIEGCNLHFHWHKKGGAQ